MRLLDGQSPADDQYVKVLHRMIWVGGYSVDLREAAVDRLAELDEQGLMRTIRQQLPLLPDGPWADRLCSIIAEREWIDLSPALVSRLSFRLPRPDASRADHQALVRLHGEENLPKVVFAVMLEASASWQQGLRSRAWDLLERLGERNRLVELVSGAEVAPDDAMLIDLRAAAADLGIVPHNREEILWARQLRKPERSQFWSQAKVVTASIPEEHRGQLELRDLSVMVSASLHDPPLLNAPVHELIDRLALLLAGERHHMGRGLNSVDQHLSDHAHLLTWGDAAAMLLARRALGVSEVVDHLFDFAARDRADTSTEYGGVIDLDRHGRFHVIEFPPRFRTGDQRFNASQEMFDAGYTALFHFHFHVQEPRNDAYAGPGHGDGEYALNTRANCLVLTSVGEHVMNVDYYRHGGVVVDLGEIRRPSGTPNGHVAE
jgi:hypothetical protein